MDKTDLDEIAKIPDWKDAIKYWARDRFKIIFEKPPKGEAS